ncbi:hypothetical protein ADUPG1_007339 [Aduncisulcus paluster]|uniref:Uncharacterized protein n=1 Tax=Aduncisulcus paluster TaxID=2918883 RepID=A0ABQ5KLP3_9EUKA|nr:hypothetical protein ADUPG1_000868 [Aduncisulcus paluster]GKT33423.1 hypothetical protein ADUPG1_007339 [Aduncisulcus paluster]
MVIEYLSFVIYLYGIRFVIDKKQEKAQEAKKEIEPKECLKKEGKEKELSDFMFSTTQSLKDLQSALSDEKKQRVHDKEEFKKHSLEVQQHSGTGKRRFHDDEERCTRHLLSKRAVVASLQSILSQVEQRPESEQFHFSVELEAVHRIVPSLK